MIQIRHLLAIVFLWCGLITQGRAKVYDHFDMVGTYKYENSEYILNLHLHTDDTFMIIDHDSYMRLGTWEITGNMIVLHFDNTKLDSLQTHHDLDKFVAKELEIMDKNNLNKLSFTQLHKSKNCICNNFLKCFSDSEI